MPGTSRKQGKGGTTVTEKELRKLNRTELLEMLIAQSKRLNRVEEELLAAQKELERRKIAITTSGSLAEAALKLNGIFEAADQAAAQYLDSLREQESNAEHIIAEAEPRLTRSSMPPRCSGRPFSPMRTEKPSGASSSLTSSSRDF